jgi:hypothetical protein
MTLIAPGRCRHCGCTDDRACRLHDGDACCWIDSTRTVCSNPECIKAETARMQRAQQEAQASKPRPRFAGWGYGAIVDQLRRERRKHGSRERGKRP